MFQEYFMNFVYVCLHDLFWEFQTMYVGRLSHFIFRSDFLLIKIKGGYQRIPTGRLVSVCAAVVPIETQQIIYTLNVGQIWTAPTYMHLQYVPFEAQLDCNSHAGMTWSNGRLLRFCDETFGHPSLAENRWAVGDLSGSQSSPFPGAASWCLFPFGRATSGGSSACLLQRRSTSQSRFNGALFLPQNRRQSRARRSTQCETVWHNVTPTTYTVTIHDPSC